MIIVHNILQDLEIYLKEEMSAIQVLKRLVVNHSLRSITKWFKENHNDC